MVANLKRGMLAAGVVAVLSAACEKPAPVAPPPPEVYVTGVVQKVEIRLTHRDVRNMKRVHHSFFLGHRDDCRRRASPSRRQVHVFSRSSFAEG